MSQKMLILVSSILLGSVLSLTADQNSYTQSFGRRNLQTSDDQLVTAEPEHHAQWRKALTLGISSLPKRGTPGQAVVFGMNAAVIAVGDSVQDVLIAAGQVGNGRVVVATHTGYADNFINGNNPDPSLKVLQANIKDWLMRGTFYNASFIMDASAYLNSNDKKALEMVKILFFQQPVREWTSNSIARILEFVRNGGGLFVSPTPWGWAQIKRSNDFNLMLTYRTLIQAGIAFSGNYIYGSNTFHLNKPTQLSHFGIQLDIVLSPERKSFNYLDSVKILEQANSLNPNILEGFYNKVSLYLKPSEIKSIAPSSSNPTSSAYRKSRLLCYQQFFLNGNLNISAPNHENFPGVVNQAASNFAYVQRQFKLTASNFREFYHTGLYAVPGEAVSIEVLGAMPNKTWSVSIGFHYDYNGGHSSWVRWPKVINRRDLTRNTTFSCGFGGLIVLESPQTNQTITIRVTRAVQAPWYDSQNITSVANWPNRKKAVGAWGCAQGKWVGFCMPRASFQTVDPLQILNTYDYIYVQYHQLRGSRPQAQRKRYIIADIRPSAGYMHSGYPIVTSLDVATPSDPYFQFNYTSLTTLGNWGIFHELGHNMQRGWWTPSGTGEVTVNIFSLLASQIALGKSPKYAPWLVGQKNSALKFLSGTSPDIWKQDAGVVLFPYAQVIEDYGWDSMKAVMSSYERGNPSTYPTSDQGKVDLFWSRYSLEVGVDLSGLLKKWRIPFTSEFTSKVVGLPAYVEKVNLFAP